METLVVQTQNLTKKFGDKLAVNQVSMHLEKGDIYGFIGKNGAGKTTTMKMLLGTIYPTSGEIELFGAKQNLDAERRKIGSLIEAPALYNQCSAWENMKRFAILAGGTDAEIKEILDYVGLGNVGKKKAGQFSLGMRQRLGIAIAMLGHPELLILDEPINGLDPAGIKEIRDLILKLNHEKGITILVSSHLLDELAKITTKYGIINDGVLVEEITATELTERCRQNLRVVTNQPAQALKIVKKLYPDGQAEIQDKAVVIYSKVDSAKLNQALVQAGLSVSELAFAQGGFEDYFIRRIGK